MPPRRVARSASRHLSPQSPAKVAPQPGSPQTRRTRGQTRDTDQGPSALPPVTEASENQDGDSSVEDEIQQSPPSQVASDASSDSQGELDALSYDLILESLLDLKADATKILDSFQAIDPLEDRVLALRDPSAPSTKRFAIQLKKLLATREAFGGRVWALPSIIVRKLRDGQAWTDIPDGMWRPDAIFYLANLAQLIAALCLGNADDATWLMDAFSFFPYPFSATHAPDRFTSAYVQDLLQVGDELRTQLFVHEARKRLNDPNFDPDELLTQIFFAEDYSARVAPLIEQIGQQYHDEHQDRLKRIRFAISKNSKNPIHFEKLEKAFTWDSFVFNATRWAVQRQRELQSLISIQDGGAEGIVEAIRAGHFNIAPKLLPPSGSPIRAAPPPRSMAKRGGRGGRAKQNLPREIAALKSRKADMAAQQTTALNPNLFENQENAAAAAALQPLLAATQQMDSGYGPVIDGDDSVPTSAQGQLSPTTAARQVQFIMGTMNEQERQANKENLGSRGITRSYMDPQPTADRVAWTPESHDEVPGPSGAKRRQAAAESGDDDDDFEEDGRQPKRPRFSKGKGRAVAEPSPVFDQQYTYPSTQPSYPSTRSPLREQAHPPSSTAPTNFPTASQLPAGTPYTSINQLAKQNVTATRERDNRHIVQQRKPYTEEEVHRLMDLIALNQGPKYAKILKDDQDPNICPEGPKLQSRSQVQLKDKARNVKMDYLKARQRLPDGFANVSVGKRMVEILRGMGIDYIEGDWVGAGKQEEGDVDVDDGA